MNYFATTQLHLAWTIILWAVTIVVVVIVGWFLLICIGGTMLAISKARKLSKARRK